MILTRPFTIANIFNLEDASGINHTVIVAAENIFTPLMVQDPFRADGLQNAHVEFPSILIGGGWGRPKTPLKNPILSFIGEDRVTLRENVDRWQSYASLIGTQATLSYDESFARTLTPYEAGMIEMERQQAIAEAQAAAERDSRSGFDGGLTSGTSIPEIITTAAGEITVTPVITDLVSTPTYGDDAGTVTLPDTVQQIPEPPNYMKWAVLLLPFLLK